MTPEEFANSLFPESNWTGDEWKARRLKIAKLIAARDAEMRKLGAERMRHSIATMLSSLSNKTAYGKASETDPIARATMHYELDIYSTIGVAVLSLPAAVAEGE